MAQKKMDFGAFMRGLAQQAAPATAETLNRLQEKMEQERQALLESRLRSVFSAMESRVTELREVRRMEKRIQEQLRDLEKRANAIVAGEDDES